MGDRKMTEAERKAVTEINKRLNEWMREVLGDVYESGRRRNDSTYWESPDQRMFCYSPWKDENGDYFTWVMKPVGRGAQSGKARRWKRVGKVVRSRTRKTARKRAQTRYQNWLKYLEEREG